MTYVGHMFTTKVFYANSIAWGAFVHPEGFYMTHTVSTRHMFTPEVFVVCPLDGPGGAFVPT